MYHTVRDEMMQSTYNKKVIGDTPQQLSQGMLVDGKVYTLEMFKELVDSLHNLCYAYRHLGGLDVAYDTELVQAQKLLDKYKDKV